MRKGVKRFFVMLLCSALLLQTQVQNVHASEAPEIAGEVAENEAEKVFLLNSAKDEDDSDDFVIEGTKLIQYTGASKDVVIPNGITIIKSNAFRENKNIKTVTMPDSVKRIENYVFYECTNLEKIQFSKSLISIGCDSFCSCGKLEEVSFPETLLSIGDAAFYEAGLKRVIIPKSVKTIANGAFGGCPLRTMTVLNPGDVTFGQYATRSYGIIVYGYPDSGSYKYAQGVGLPFVSLVAEKTETDIDGLVIVNGVLKEYNGGEKKLEIPEGVTEIGSYAFYSNDVLEEIILPGSLKIISDFAFAGCKHLEKVNFSYGLEKIGCASFSRCTNIKEVLLPNSLQHIEGGAFHSCAGLEKIIIPDSVTEIGESAFAYCNNLREISLPKSLNKIGNYTLCGCTSLEKIIIPDSVEKIGNYAFYNCKDLEDISLSNSLKYIGERAFAGCDQLVEVIVPDSVTAIGACAFSNCKNLEEVQLPKKLNNISDSVFKNCTKLTIYAYEGSYAANYARRYNIKLVIINQPETLKVSITPATLELIAGDFDRLTTSKLPEGKTVTWVSENDSIAQVYADGTVVAFSEGTVKIYAKVEGASNTPYCTVMVKPTPKEKAPEEYTEAEKENFIEYIARKCKPYIDKSQIKDIVINDYNNHGEESEATLKKYGITLEKILSIFERVFNE